MKKFSKVISSIFLLIGLICNCGVIHAEDVENGNEIYQEIGQIDLRVLNVNYNAISDEINIVAQKSTKSVVNKNLLEYELNNNPDYEEVLKMALIDGSAPEVIGYTRVYLKDVIEDDGSTHQEPMTNAEYQAYLNNSITIFAIGGNSNSPGGNLTLYTGASFRGDEIYANSYASYSANTGITDTPADGYYDFVGLTFPKEYTLKSGFGIVTSNYRTYIADEKDNSALVAVLLKGSISVPMYKVANLAGVGALNTDKPSSIKIISSYCHTYGGINVSAGISATGGSITITGTTKYWTIYSSVML